MCKQESLAWLVPLPMPAIFFALRGIAKGEDARMLLSQRRHVKRKRYVYATIFAYAQLKRKQVCTHVCPRARLSTQFL